MFSWLFGMDIVDQNCNDTALPTPLCTTRARWSLPPCLIFILIHYIFTGAARAGVPVPPALCFQVARALSRRAFSGSPCASRRVFSGSPCVSRRVFSGSSCASPPCVSRAPESCSERKRQGRRHCRLNRARAPAGSGYLKTCGAIRGRPVRRRAFGNGSGRRRWVWPGRTARLPRPRWRCGCLGG